MKNKEAILRGLDAVIAKLKAESKGSQQQQKDIAAYQLIRDQYEAENLEAARHTYNFVMDTYLREMLPEECGETLGFKRIK
ncbi:hypothetical protein STSP2_01112 [Anaerohalosphaera lusitana]|uniref:Uncharacterized protein n=1 Tax=Anaerohalosphaera lusitana TaxID=1936003 RepID=A0A1U9NK48_9BACT|nr:hypothetical protein [Anaerohalosphaera lusitana]AQT67960.1 hypothetical protein STSP2_01112 [Anaerohalosphaera lusitana]